FFKRIRSRIRADPDHPEVAAGLRSTHDEQRSPGGFPSTRPAATLFPSAKGVRRKRWRFGQSGRTRRSSVRLTIVTPASLHIMDDHSRVITGARLYPSETLLAHHTKPQRS